MTQSTLSYLDAEGRISFWRVPWKKLNLWLSILNGNPHVNESVDNVNRGNVIEELEQRREGNGKSLSQRGISLIFDRGISKDWREYENDDGYTHLEELIIYQPTDWRKQTTKQEEVKQLIKDDISPLDFFFEFQKFIQAFSLDRLAAIGKEVALSRLILIKELDFGNIIGQRLAKHMIN
jgi:hypothetical protein